MTHAIPPPGDFSWDDAERQWWYSCPDCHETGSLDEHEVCYADGKFTLTPAVICGGCGKHFRVVASEWFLA
jgi:uncharacterized CHY-type Zn-finger protein